MPYHKAARMAELSVLVMGDESRSSCTTANYRGILLKFIGMRVTYFYFSFFSKAQLEKMGQNN